MLVRRFLAVLDYKDLGYFSILPHFHLILSHPLYEPKRTAESTIFFQLCWDGTYKGVEQDWGVYVYMIKAKTICDAEIFRKGTLVLVR